MLAAVLWATLALAATGSESTGTPLSQGPAQGTSAPGQLRHTTTISGSTLASRLGAGDGTATPTGKFEPVQLPSDFEPIPSSPAGSNEIDDPAGSAPANAVSGQPLELTNSFPGIPDVGDAFGFSHIPPDPIMAAGPNHLMGLINSAIGIFDKSAPSRSG